MKRVIYCFIAAIIFTIGFISYTNWHIKQVADKKLYSFASEIPKNKVGLLLGTAQYLKGGGINPFFKNRIDAAVFLFRMHKIDYILVSGDNRHVSYNEPRDFKKALLKKGIPEDRIVLDYAGFRTLDSVIRAHLVFGQESFTVISQKFQNERAIYIAEKNGISVIGFNAKDPEQWSKVYWREFLARAKSYVDIAFHKKPKFLGEPIFIE